MFTTCGSDKSNKLKKGADMGKNKNTSETES